MTTETTSARDLYPLQAQLDAIDDQDLDYEAQVEANNLRDQVWSAQDELGGIVYRIPEERVPELEKDIEKMGKRCEKLGIESPTVSDSGLRDDEEVQNDAKTASEIRTWAYVVVGGQPPILGGWAFLATLQHEDTGTIVRRVPSLRLTGDEQRNAVLAKLDLRQYRNAQPVCDHCNTRRIRRDTYIVVHEDGEVKQVGSNCLLDFTGGLNAQQAAKGFEYIKRAFKAGRRYESEGFTGLRPEWSYSTSELLSTAAMVIREEGFVPKSRADEWGKAPTSTHVGRVMEHGFYYDDEWSITDEDRQTAADALAWIRDELPGESDYEHNLKTSVAGDHTKARSLGIAISGVGIFVRNRDKAAKQAEAPGLNEHFGNEKDRVKLTLTVAKHQIVNSMMTPHLHTMKDGEGRTFKWFGSYELDEGKTYQATWTIRGHDEWNGQKQTKVNRPFELEEVSV